MLTEQDMAKVREINEANGWGFFPDELEELILAHKSAKEGGDAYGMELVEYRLEDCNYHSANRGLDAGLHDLMLDSLKIGWDEFEAALSAALNR